MLAKRGVGEHRVPFRVGDELRRCQEMTKQRAMWIARAAVEANSLPNYPYSDSESSRQAAEVAKRLKEQADAKLKPAEAKRLVGARPPVLGGHVIPPHAGGKKYGWKCIVCRETSILWERFDPPRCGGQQPRIGQIERLKLLT